MQDAREDSQKTRKELAALRKRVSELEAFEAKHRQAERDLTDTRKELEELLTASPVVIYRAEPAGSYAATFVGRLRAGRVYG